MAQAPVILYDSRGKAITSAARGNRLIPAATQNYDRKWVPLLDGDPHRNVSNYGRRTLLSLGRHIYFTFGVVRGAVEDTAEHCASTWMLDYRGVDPVWKQAAETLLYAHDRYCDVAGPPHTARTYRCMLARMIFVDGDMGTLLVRDADGTPKLQIIPAHRINSEDGVVAGGEFDGARVIDGVIVNGQNKPVGYRVLTGEPSDLMTFVDIPATSMFLSFLPLLPGQVRGFSLLGVSAFDWQDVSEARRWELLAQKAGAGRVFQEFNETGEPPVGADYITDGGATGSSTRTDTPSGLWYEQIEGGLNSYFKSSDPNARLEAVKFDRPSSNQQQFHLQVLREIFSGTGGLSFDFNLDLSKLGGATARILLEKVERNMASIRDKVIEPAARRFDAYRLASFMSSGALPFTEDWLNWEYQGPPELTADKKYSSDVAKQEMQSGIMTRARWAAMRGESLMDVRAQREQEASDLFERAQRLSTKYGVSFDLAMQKLESDSASAQFLQAAPPSADQPSKAKEEDSE